MQNKLYKSDMNCSRKLINTQSNQIIVNKNVMIILITLNSCFQSISNLE